MKVVPDARDDLAVSGRPRRGARVLLVEDDALGQEVACGMLAEFGLTPAARGRLIALPEVKTDGKASYFARPTKAG